MTGPHHGMQASSTATLRWPSAVSVDAVAARQVTAAAGPVEVRRIPYPFRAMIALCSDLDETPDAFVYRETARFLNTTDMTCMGPGVGLEAGNTIYFDMPRGQFAYWNADEAGRAMVRALIRSGHIDCLHSYGDLATTRRHAALALEELARHDCQLRVWVDHATAPSNFGQDIMRGEGDVPGAEAYHADLTVPFGIRYVWRGRVTSVIGQEVRRRLGGLFHAAHPLSSLRTVGKEAVKGAIGRTGVRRYAPHGHNAVVWPAQLRSGHRVQEFLRSNPHWGGVSCGDTAEGIPDILTPRVLDRLVSRRGISVIYTHLGKVARRDEPLQPRTREALRRLADRARAREVLVTTTRRVLDYCAARRTVTATLLRTEAGDRIELSAPDTLESTALQGLTLYVPDPVRTTLWLGDQPLAAHANPADDTGRPSISLAWTPLRFPHL